MRALTFIIAFMALRFLVTAGESSQPQTDAEIRQKIIGTWIMHVSPTSTNKLESYSADGTVTYATNGSYVADATITYAAKTHEDRCAGLWSVDGRILSDSVTNAVGVETGSRITFKHAKVVRVDEKVLILVEELDQIVFLEREK